MSADGLEILTPWGVGLAVEFERVGDRYRHLIKLSSREAAEGSEAPPSCLVLQSLEGSGGEAWPISPPLQSLSIEDLAGGRRAALLVGMAGKSHWSASIEAIAASHSVVFDFACRSATRPDWLGCHYHLAPNIDQRVQQAAGGKGNSIKLNAEGKIIRLTGSTDATTLADIRASPNDIAIECHLPPEHRGPTYRWRYQVELLPPDDR